MYCFFLYLEQNAVPEADISPVESSDLVPDREEYVIEDDGSCEHECTEKEEDMWKDVNVRVVQ